MYETFDGLTGGESAQEEIRINPNGRNTTNTINRAELVGVHAWLKSINQDEALPGSIFKLLTDSQVTLQSIQKAIKLPTSTWLSTHEPLLQDIVSHLKSLTRQGHHVHMGKVKAHSGVRGNIQADHAAKSVVIQKIIDAEGNLNAFTEEELALMTAVTSVIMPMSIMNGQRILFQSKKVWTGRLSRNGRGY